MNPVPYDPKLRAAMEEIKAVVAKHDCMALVILASQTHNEFLFEPETTWSLVKWEDRLNGKLRFRSKLEDHPSKEVQDRLTAATAHGLESMRWISLKNHEQLSQLHDALSKHMRILTNVAPLMGRPDSVPGDGR